MDKVSRTLFAIVVLFEIINHFFYISKMYHALITILAKVQT
jgi:hypothetical protein